MSRILYSDIIDVSYHPCIAYKSPRFMSPKRNSASKLKFFLHSFPSSKILYFTFNSTVIKSTIQSNLFLVENQKLGLNESVIMCIESDMASAMAYDFTTLAITSNTEKLCSVSCLIDILILSQNDMVICKFWTLSPSPIFSNTSEEYHCILSNRWN